ncbi:MAG: glutathione S-transferase family protein [Pseudomonadota bacterium]
MKLWHCVGARSLRPLWALEELGMDYEIEVLPFPPRMHRPEFVEENVLGTVPFFTDQVDGQQITMTESCAIAHYLAGKAEDQTLLLQVQHAEYPELLNWTYHADATLTFPQTIFLRYSALEPDENKKLVGNDYAKWFIARLRRLDAHLLNHEYLVADRFTVADICVGYALWLGRELGLHERYKPQTIAYLERLVGRDGFRRADGKGRDGV